MMKCLLVDQDIFDHDTPCLLMKICSLEAVSPQRFSQKCNQWEYIQIEIIVCRFTSTIDKAVLSRMPKLKAIFTVTTGTDHIDLVECESRGIRVFSLRGERDFLEGLSATAELAIGLVIMVARGLGARACNQQIEPTLKSGVELQGKNCGVVGFGRLGSKFAQYATSLGMTVRFFDPYVVSEKYEKVDSLKELLLQSDVISLHVPLSAETENLLCSEMVNYLRRNAIVVNTSRPQIVDEKALYNAVAESQIHGYGVDFPLSPNTAEMINQQSTSLNIIVTPHIGGITVESVKKADLFMVEKLEAYLNELNS